jgi:quercetin dioxygenase-like cupin family protein
MAAGSPAERETNMSKQSDIFLKDSENDWQDLGAGVRRKILCYDGSIMMARVAFEAGAVGPEHTHPHVQCSMVESGCFDITINGRTERLRAGDSFIVPSGALHSAAAVEAGVLLDTFTPMRADFLE